MAQSEKGSSPEIDDLTICVQSDKEYNGKWNAGILAILEYIRTHKLHEYRVEIIDRRYLDSTRMVRIEIPDFVSRLEKPPTSITPIARDLYHLGLNLDPRVADKGFYYCYITCSDKIEDGQLTLVIKVNDPERPIWLQKVVPMVLSHMGPGCEVEIWKNIGRRSAMDIGPRNWAEAEVFVPSGQ